MTQSIRYSDSCIQNVDSISENKMISEPYLWMKSKVSYLSQKPWLISGTIKENVIMNLPYDKTRFDEAVEDSGLIDDIKNFKEGIEKNVGEAGEGQSGGQRARVALAMCLYQDADILILDDLLSALDAQTAAHVMQNTLVKHMKNKTRIIVTHALQHLPNADYIYLMDEGTILKEGKYEDQQDCELLIKYKELEQYGYYNMKLPPAYLKINLK